MHFKCVVAYTRCFLSMFSARERDSRMCVCCVPLRVCVRVVCVHRFCLRFLRLRLNTRKFNFHRCQRLFFAASKPQNLMFKMLLKQEEVLSGV